MQGSSYAYVYQIKYTLINADDWQSASTAMQRYRKRCARATLPYEQNG